MNTESVAIRVPERHKQTGLCYAVTDDGIELPVIDVTQPAFTFNPTDAEFAEITERTLRGFEQGAKWPSFVLKLMARRSLVMRNVLKAAGTYLDGVAACSSHARSRSKSSGSGPRRPSTPVSPG